MRVTCISFTNHTMQPITTIKQMRWSHTQTERAYNVPVVTNYNHEPRLLIYIYTLYISQANGVLKVEKNTCDNSIFSRLHLILFLICVYKEPKQNNHYLKLQPYPHKDENK